ncbi:MAG TPA: hypothetical protein VEY30_00845 [Myxococcaceae bacterium]|nr:hypothetical protein [Myxococcaceae bacterium]
MGRFAFRASPSPERSACSLPEVAFNEFDFEGTFSRTRDGAQLWLTLNDVSEPATFDGQVARSERSAPRSFSSCRLNASGGLCQESSSLRESLAVAFLSRSQNEALGGACPPNALKEGIPETAPDGGTVTPPGTETGRFDALRACGELEDVVVPGADCVCAPCRLVYAVTGVRK